MAAISGKASIECANVALRWMLKEERERRDTIARMLGLLDEDGKPVAGVKGFDEEGKGG